jgi:sensor histidine kinase YesM
MKPKSAYWTCQVLGWGAYSVMGASAAARQIGWRFSLIAGYALFFLYSIALTDLLRREIRRRQWLSEPSRTAYLRVFLAAATVGTIQAFLVISIEWLFEGERSSFSRASAMLSAWLGIIAVTVIWTTFYLALTARRRFREKEVHLQLALREAELRALEAQINPHFLFNCLNSIRGLVAENPGLARDMITRLANILRYNLHRDLNHTVPLVSEVEVVSDYLALEAVRFEDRLRVEFAIDDGARQFPVPPMLLQALVENALKHGIAPLPDGGDLFIRAAVQPDGMVVEVENTGQLGESEPGIGLANTRERLRILYGGRASFELENRGGNRVAATVRIPGTA